MFYRHYHSFENFASYDILDSQGNLAAEGHKASYCLRDSLCLRNYKGAFNCDENDDQGNKQCIFAQGLHISCPPVSSYICFAFIST